MGCCASRPRESDTGAPVARAHSSYSTRPSSQRSLRVSHGNLHQVSSRQEPEDRPNSPLLPIPGEQRSRLPESLVSPTAKHARPLTDSTNQTWTRVRLVKEREDWWDTQVTGSEEIWGAIRLASQHLQAGQLQEAQTMLDVTGCTCPTGLLWQGVYDSTGVQYKVPEWVVVEPEGLVEDDEEDQVAGSSSLKAVSHVDGQSLADEKDENVRVCARTSHNQRDVMMNITKKQPVGSIAEKLKNQAKLDPSSRVRLAYGGRLYQDHEILESHPHWNFANEHVLTALVISTP